MNFFLLLSLFFAIKSSEGLPQSKSKHLLGHPQGIRPGAKTAEVLEPAKPSSEIALSKIKQEDIANFLSSPLQVEAFVNCFDEENCDNPTFKKISSK